MIVISRLKDQSMILGDDLMVTLAEVQTDRVLLVISQKSGDRIAFWEESGQHWIEDGATMPLASGVSVTVWIKDDRVRLGFDAPRETTIHRKEVYDALHRF